MGTDQSLTDTPITKAKNALLSGYCGSKCFQDKHPEYQAGYKEMLSKLPTAPIPMDDLRETIGEIAFVSFSRPSKDFQEGIDDATEDICDTVEMSLSDDAT